MPPETCARKVRYPSWQAAEDAALRVMEHEPRSDAQAYACSFCSGWHYGHPPGISRATVGNPQRATNSRLAWR